MSWIGLLLVGVGVTDLVFSVRPSRVLPEVLGSAAAVLLALAADLTGPGDLLALAFVVAVVLAWGQTVTWGLGQGPPWVPLVVLGSGLTVLLLVSGAAGPAGGLVATWLDGTSLTVLDDYDADRAMLLLGVLLVQLSTGNVLVRLVLAATHTVNPARHGTPSDPGTRLKGGRLLGPMERLFIVCLGLAGQVTAASIVVAAKGLLRFPELQSRRDQERIHRLTEYFLVGSFASWLVALAGLVLLG
ncbi:hypothetical protein [Nocardioides euryhalodurans]|uniref:Uncharacterized protein n=1 Tax=Nocardioides euryhalodurans TaxID=2518370 RepID=A0A4P7GI23_9ACTN|nr:hypothetical protein [Nocardioides euryhalodurans]QBR91536.1 hypothetical protein EXE57_04055 [Nocardioides euryhalodurans]